MNQKNHWIKVTALALSTALLLSGCSGGGEKSDTSKKDTDVSASSSSDVSSDAPKDYSKYNKYLDVADIINDDIEPILITYFDNVDYAAEFNVIGDYSAIKDAVQFYTANTYPVEEALDYAKEEPAYPKVDAAILAMGDSMIQVMEALDDLAAYMRFDDFEDDNMAKAPEIHAALWKALEIYDTYYNNYLDAVSEMASGSRDEDRAELLEEGQMVLYHSLTMIHTSQDILDEIWTQVEAANAETGPEDEMVIPSIDMTNLSALFGQIQTAYDGLNETLEDQEGKEKVFSGPVGDSAMKLYMNKVNSLYSCMGRLAEDLTGDIDYAEDYNKASEAISSMIDGYNSII